MAKMTRDQKLAAKLRAQQGDSYQSATDRSRSRSSVDTDVSDTNLYNSIRDTEESLRRRASSKSPDSVSRWRRSVDPEWNR